jgi:FkbM family methyltransferase
MIDLIIFSKNRAMQLDICLASICKNIQENTFQITIIYKYDNNSYKSGYEKCIKKYPNINWVVETNFKNNVLHNIHSKYVCFLVDDAVFYRAISHKEITDLLYTLDTNPDIFSFLLGVGHNTTFSYTANIHFSIPNFQTVTPITYKWNWKNIQNTGEFACPLMLVGNIFRSQEFIPLIQDMSFSAPNDFEQILQDTYQHEHKNRNRLSDYLVCFQYSKLLHSPNNTVQNIQSLNKYGEKQYLDPIILNNYYLQNIILTYQIDTDKVNGLHHEIVFNPIIDFAKVIVGHTKYGEMVIWNNDQFARNDIASGYLLDEKMILTNLVDIVKQSKVILDIGGHIGSHTILYHHINPKCTIHTFEPQKELFKLLQFNVCNNVRNIENVYLYNMAVGHSVCKCHMDNHTNDGSNTDKSVVYGGNTMLNLSGLRIGTGGEAINMVTVDSFNFNRCDFIKIDTEGFDPLVLQGAKNTILRFKPSIQFEWNGKIVTDDMKNIFNLHHVPTCFEFLESIGYTIKMLEFGNYLATI